ncbi:hypothetical protein SprV_0401627600 [Sparganum proliferum]
MVPRRGDAVCTARRCGLRHLAAWAECVITSRQINVSIDRVGVRHPRLQQFSPRLVAGSRQYPRVGEVELMAFLRHIHGTLMIGGGRETTVRILPVALLMSCPHIIFDGSILKAVTTNATSTIHSTTPWATTATTSFPIPAAGENTSKASPVTILTMAASPPAIWTGPQSVIIAITHALHASAWSVTCESIAQRLASQYLNNQHTLEVIASIDPIALANSGTA